MGDAPHLRSRAVVDLSVRQGRGCPGRENRSPGNGCRSAWLPVSCRLEARSQHVTLVDATRGAQTGQYASPVVSLRSGVWGHGGERSSSYGFVSQQQDEHRLPQPQFVLGWAPGKAIGHLQVGLGGGEEPHGRGGLLVRSIGSELGDVVKCGDEGSRVLVT